MSPSLGDADLEALRLRAPRLKSPDHSKDFELTPILSRRSVRVSAGFVLFCAIGSRSLPWFRAMLWTWMITIILTTLAWIYIVCTSVRRWRASDISHHPLKTFRPFAFTSPTKWASEIDAIKRDEALTRAPLYPPSFVVSSALDGLLATILKDFVTEWYSKISPDPVFTNQVDKSIRYALKDIADRVLKLDLVEVAVGRIVPLLTTHMADFSSAEKAVRGKNLSKQLTESEELDLAIAAKYREGRLHPAASLAYADPKLAQQDHLRKIVEKVLPLVMPKKEIASRTVGIITKELVSCAVMYPIFTMLADPDFWNQTIEIMGRSTLHDRKTVQKLRAALDEHATPETTGSHMRTFSRLTPKADQRSYENFIRSIMQCGNLSDLRRLRNEVSSQLKKDSKVENQDQMYLERLAYSKRILDSKVEKLSDGGSGQITPTNAKSGFRRSLIEKTKGLSRSHTLNGSIVGLEQARMCDILRSSSGLSYFMEFMDRRKRIALVQFWLLVDGLRNPLEDDPDEDDEAVPSQLTWSSSDRNDISHIYQTYFSDEELEISERSKEAVKVFIKAGRNAIPLQYWQARGAILRAQTATYDNMAERDLPNFKKSDLFYKYLASDDASTMMLSRPASRNGSRNASRNVSRNVSPERPPRRSISPIKQFQVRRSASSTNMNKLLASPTTDLALVSRHSFDVKRPRLFDDDFEPETTPRRSLETDKGSNGRFSPGFQRSSDDVVEEMEAALKDILHETPSSSINGDSRRPSVQHGPGDYSRGLFPGDSPKSSLDLPRSVTPNIIDVTKTPSFSRGKAPSLAALGLVDSLAAKSVFAGEELFPDETPDTHQYEEERKTSDSESDIDYVHEAAPGNLGLAEAISELTISINKLYGQEGIISTMLKKAELTNNTAELRILNKSKASVQREIRRKELQKQQYIVQESDNSLYGRATIKINKSIVGYEQGGKEYGIYIIEVQRKGGEQSVAAEWIVQRRYSAFWQLHQDLRAKYPPVQELEFPRRKMVLKLQKDFLDKRRKALEAYLRSLLLNAEVCRSRELRAFLSEQSLPPIPVSPTDIGDDKTDFISKLYNSIADSMEDVIGNIPMMEQLSQQLTAAMPTSPVEDGAFKTTTVGGGELNVAEAEVELSAFENGEKQPFVKPICDIFLETFELNKGSSWLRGRAVIVVLHQLLGGTIERKVRDQAKVLTDEDNVLRYIQMIRDALAPEKERHVRTAKEKAKSRADAGVMLATLVPDMTASVVGRANAQAASRRLAAIVNNQRLNCHVAFKILDILVDVLFPEL